MSRSDAVRQAALERDGYRCQVTGVGGAEWAEKGVVEVHHWKALGVGGSDELDSLDNVITTATKVHRGHIHPEVSIPKMRITHWDPNDLQNGLLVERRDKSGDPWEPIPRYELWFYRKQLVAHVSESIGNMHKIQTLTGFHAMTMFELRLVWRDLYPDAVSFDQVVSSLGWDPGEADDLADKHEWLLMNKCMWPEGLTNRQLTEIIDRAAPITLFDDETDSMQTLLNIAAEKSFSDVRNALVRKGLRLAQPYYYIVFPEELLFPPPRAVVECGGVGSMYQQIDRPIRIIHTRDEEEMKQAIYQGALCPDIKQPVVLRMGKAVMNAIAKRHHMTLGNGTKIDVIAWEKEAVRDDSK